MMIEAGLVPIFVNLLDAESEEELVIFRIEIFNHSCLYS